jgi:glycogen(starch) synthase
MRILITTDTVGGVWTYTRELVTGLMQRGHSIILVSLGKVPRRDQLEWLHSLPFVPFQYHPSSFPLEWMQDSESGIAESFRFLEHLIGVTKPDILHTNQFCYGALDCGIPKVMVAHSDVFSWWNAVHGNPPPDSSWFRWYKEIVSNGLAKADVVVAPSRWMLNSAKQQYSFAARGRVIYNGRNPALFNPSHKKEPRAVTVGRVWDEGKQVGLLLACHQSLAIEIVGPQQPPDKTQTAASPRPHLEDVKLSDTQSESDVCTLLAHASIYVATSRYEPFGLAPVEAALSRCALIANDIPAFRELWEDCTIYFRTNDPRALSEVLLEVASDSKLRDLYADRAYHRARNRFDSKLMVDEYESLYHELASKSAAG